VQALLAMPRPSFRQLLLAAFVVMALLLGGVALRGQWALEALLEKSRAEAARSLNLTAQAERLGELSQGMERSARQYLVLGDTSLRSAFQRAASDADGVVQTLANAGVAADAAAVWRSHRGEIDTLLAAGPNPARDAELVSAFRALASLRMQQAERLRADTAARNTALQGEVDAARLALGRQWAGAGALGLVLALALAYALARPLARVEQAIVALGDNRLEDRIDIRGPADVRTLGRRLDWLRQRLLGLDADKSRFLRHVSHELKTPLAALREGVALLDDGVAGPLAPGQREVVRILADNTAALQRRIEDLLSFNATAFAAARPVRRPVALHTLLRSLVAEQQLQWRAKGLRVEVQGDEATADVDEALIRTALGNLLANAIRYSPAQRSAGIMLTLQRQGDGVAITVSDQGPGVPAAERERIFEPFYRGAAQPALADGELPGTGIGLSIVAEAVAAHGGTVVLLDDLGPGAHFRLDLPHALAD
jgi:two-component system, NtrC family, sensor histidine kinase GlrK